MKAMTAAFKKIQDGRDQMNADKQKIMAKDLSSCVYLCTSVTGKPAAVFFAGRATWKNPTQRYSYRSVESRAERVAEWMATVAANSGGRRKPAPRALDIGDIISASWGYDQTNVDYYKVVGLKGATMVKLIEIGAMEVPSGGFVPMSGECVPDPTVKMGEVFERRANGDRVKIDDVRYASKDYPDSYGNYVPRYYSSYA